VAGWADGPQHAALDSGWQHVLSRVFSQQAADDVSALGVDDVTVVMTDLPREYVARTITPA